MNFVCDVSPFHPFNAETCITTYGGLETATTLTPQATSYGGLETATTLKPEATTYGGLESATTLTPHTLTNVHILHNRHYLKVTTIFCYFVI